jgi:G3E family GTPase
MMARTPVAVVTGFLGSGKTTLLSRLLAHPELRDTAVIVNELGEVAIDHHLLRRVDESTVLLANGCVCCAIRDDLAGELRSLLSRRERGEVPPFARVVVETTGLADPGPILSTLLSEPVVQHHYAPGPVITTVDAVHGLAQLERDDESVRQAAAADRLVVTKADLADPEETAELERRLRRLNPVAPVLRVSFGAVEPAALLGGGAERDPREQVPEGTYEHEPVSSYCLLLDEPLDWTAFGTWLTMLLASRGEQVLRVKGLLDVGAPGPVVLDAVQHVVHPPRHLDSWPDGDRRTRLVFITRRIDREALERSLLAFDQAATAA